MASRTAFPRVFGEIVHDSFSITSFFTGLLAALPTGLVLLFAASGPRSKGDAVAVLVVWMGTVLVFVSRFAQVGVAGDTEGGLFSSAAGHWGDTLLAAARLLALWAAWAVPFVAWELLKGAETGAVPVFGLVPFGLPRLPFLLSLWSGLGVVLSFAFVAVAAAAPGFGSLFSPALWRTLFGGRLGELFLAIAGVFGPPLTILLVVLPVFGALAPRQPKLALTAFVPLLLYAVGMVLTLQGKLCGAFAAASLAEEADEALLDEAAPQAGPPSMAPAATEPAAPSTGDPESLQAIWQARLSAGDLPGALEAARLAIPAGLAKGSPKAAAGIYRQHLDRLDALGLDRPALSLLADQLLRDGDVAAAAWTFSQALDAEPGDAKAFKGLLRVAEHHLEKAKAPPEAIRVYRYLLERAPGSPLADHARDLLADVERKAAREPSAPGRS
ncbi:MAG: tetratricopeptide repeat protein [Thermoanaerobaculia bacterium]